MNRFVNWVLIDGMVGGSGKSFPLDKLVLPDWVFDSSLVKNGWLIAGGLTPDSVADVCSQLHDCGLHPWGVDVSSGVCDETGLNKSKAKIERFVRQMGP